MVLGCLVCAAILIGLRPDHAARAQPDGGQFWARLYEDRDGDGARDEGEPPITRGVAVMLLDAQNVVIATSALDSSPYAARGEVGFQYLAAGDYTLQVTASEWSPTTLTTFTRAIRTDDVPTVVEVGARRIIGGVADAGLPLAARAVRSERAQIALAGVGAALVAGGMFALGLMIVGIMRRRL
jgi:hypothetical protein